jgi:pimeloyl-ACP methyl ester carboxylesterase
VSRGARRSLLVAAIVVLLAAQWWHHHAPSGTPSNPRHAPIAARAAAREPLRLGSLTLEPCLIGNHTSDGVPTQSAFCTRVSVPENWDLPSGRRIELMVAIVQAETAGPLTDLITFLDGGPGGAATEDYPLLAAAFEPLRQHHHILLVDQRGTGESRPLDCPELPSNANRLPESSAGSAGSEGAAMGLLRRCLAELEQHAEVAHYTTTAAVRDLEAVRQALGAPLLDLIGVSYGTRVAQQYAARYPQSVRAMVLDGPVPNRLALLSEHARNLERTLQALFDACRASPACAAHFGNPTATLYRLRDALRAHPRAVELRDPVTFGALHLTFTAQDLAAIVRFYAYNPASAALLPLMLHEADVGNFAPLLGQKKWLAEDLGDHITSGMELSVVCAEDADLLAPRPEDEATLLGNELITQVRAACAFWPHEPRPANFHAPLVSSVPTLVLAGELDPVTPPAYGGEIVRHLSHARLLVAPGQGHGVSRVGCMPELLREFIARPDPQALDAACLQRLGPMPAFLDYNGPAP